MQFVGGVFSYEPSDDGELCDWWLYEDKHDPADPPVGRRRLRPRRGEGHRHHLRGDAQGLLGPQGPPRGHGRQLDRGPDVLPVASPGSAASASWRPQDKELADLCVKAYNDWMVEEWCGDSERPPHPAHHHPAVGRRAGRRRGAPQRRPRRAGRVLQRDPAVPRPARRSTRDYWEPVLPGLRRDRHRHQHAHRLVVEDAVDLGRRPRRGGLHAHVRQRHGVDDRLAVLGLAGRAARPSSWPTPRARSAGSPTSSSGPTRSGRRTGRGVASATRSPSRRPPTTTARSTAASSTTCTASRTSRSAASTTSASRPTTRTRTAPGRTRGGRRMKLMGDLPDGRRPQAGPRQRHRAARPRLRALSRRARSLHSPGRWT